MLYSDLAVRVFTRLFLFQMTVLMEAACTEMVLCHYTVSCGHRHRVEASVLTLLDFAAALSEWSTRYYYYGIVGAISPRICTRILTGIILVASRAPLVLAYEAYAIILRYCSVGWRSGGVHVFPLYVTAMMWRGQKAWNNQVIFLGSSRHWVLLIFVFSALLGCPSLEIFLYQ